MEQVVKQFKVFVASPGDVSVERDAVPKVIAEINLILSALAPEKKILVDLIRWETHTHPGLGADAQDVVNRQLPDYDIFIGIMWKRFGTPTSRAGSGTEEEYKKAFEKWKTNDKFPVLFYFSQKDIAIPGSVDEIEQLRKVVKFRQELSNKGLIWEYKEAEDFGDIIRPHLVLTLSKLINVGSDAANQQPSEKVLTKSDLALVWKKVSELTNEYLSTRESMQPGPERTRQMATIESKMRAMALDLEPLLPELTISTSPGERLAAIAALRKYLKRNISTGWQKELEKQKFLLSGIMQAWPC